MKFDHFQLSLTVSTSNKCFTLTAKERQMGPDDWAWRFLRLNSEYRQAFENPEFNASEIVPATRNLLAPAQRFLSTPDLCQPIFGLSSLLHPGVQELPKRQNGESWFAPLRSIVVEPRFSALGKELYGYRIFHKHLESTNYAPLFEEEAQRRKANGKQPWMDSDVWFAIDCSVPPDAQLATIEFVATRYAEEMRKEGLTKSHYYCCEPTITDYRDCSPFLEMQFPRAHANTAEFADSKSTWRMLRLSLVGVTEKEIDKCRIALRKIHAGFVQDGLAQQPVRERFKPELDGTKDGFGRDGSTLKAYVIIAECTLLGGLTDPKDIVRCLAEKGAGSEVLGASQGKFKWIDDLEERAYLFETYINRAREYVEGGYKWLVFSQSPRSTGT